MSAHYLDSGFGQTRLDGQFLPGVDVRVLGPFEGAFQFLQLLRAERRARTALLALQRDAGLRLDVRVVLVARTAFDKKQETAFTIPHFF